MSYRRDPVLRLSEIKSMISRYERLSESPPTKYERTSDLRRSSVLEEDEVEIECDTLVVSAKTGSRLRVPWFVTGLVSRLLQIVFYCFSCCVRGSHMNLAILSAGISFFSPRILTYTIIYPSCRLLFGTLYPAYASYKAVRTKNVKEYVKWMMYWIVFALFTCAETFTDVFLSWFPFYYEIKIILVFWLLSPATKGSSILYRKFVHPALCRREQEIDECILKAKEQGYHTVLSLGTKGVNYATNVIMQTAIKGGGGLVQQLRKSYSLSDLTISDDQSDGHGKKDMNQLVDSGTDHRVVRRSVSVRGRNPRPISTSRVDMYFPEVDVNSRPMVGRESVNLSHIRSSEDITYIPENTDGDDLLTRTSSVGGNVRNRNKINRNTFTAIKRPGAAEENQVIIEEVDDLGRSSFYIESDMSNVSNVCDDPMFGQYLNFLLANNVGMREQGTDLGAIYMNYLQFKQMFDVPDYGDQKISDNNLKSDQKKVDDDDEPLRSKNENKETEVPSNHENCSDELKNTTTKEENSNRNQVISEMNEIVAHIDSCKVEQLLKTDVVLIDNYEALNNNDLKLQPIEIEVKASNEDIKEIIVDDKQNMESVIMDKDDSDGDDNEDNVNFITPSGSPVPKSKIEKSPKYKKRQAPPPPSNIPESKEEQINITLSELPIESISNIVLKSADLNKENKTDIDHDTNADSKSLTSSSSDLNCSEEGATKSKSKNKQGISKLLHLPTKFAFWNKSDSNVNLNDENIIGEGSTSIDGDSKSINASLTSLRSVDHNIKDVKEPSDDTKTQSTISPIGQTGTILEIRTPSFDL